MTARIVGIDPSLTATGIARADGGLVTVGSKPTDGTVSAELTRVVTLVEQIVIAAQPFDLVVIEAPSFGQGKQAGDHLRAGLWWLLTSRLSAARAEVVRVPPAVLKKLATGKGNATKPDMRMALFQRAGVDCRDDNQVDAWWLRECGRQHFDHPGRLSLPALNLGALAKVQWPAPDTCPF